LPFSMFEAAFGDDFFLVNMLSFRSIIGETFLAAPEEIDRTFAVVTPPLGVRAAFAVEVTVAGEEEGEE
ncbi:hypothetical protein PENTCL1PPCAC_20732, partial [Pristionchus entomophagus]